MLPGSLHDIWIDEIVIVLVLVIVSVIVIVTVTEIVPPSTCSAQGWAVFLAPGMVAGRGRSTQSHQRKDRPPFWHGRCCIQRQCRASELDGGGRGKARRMKALVSHHPYGLHLPHCFRSDGRMLPSQAAAHVQVCPIIIIILSVFGLPSHLSYSTNTSFTTDSSFDCVDLGVSRRGQQH